MVTTERDLRTHDDEGDPSEPPRASRRRRVAVPILVVLALLAGVAIGSVLFARSTSAPSGDAAAAPTADPTSTEATIVGDAPAGDASAPGGAPGVGEADPGGSDADQPAPDGLQVVTPAAGAPYAYTESDRGLEGTGTLPPPELPITVRLSATTDLVDGQPISISVTPKDGFPTEVYGFEARFCKADATFSGLYDFFPTVSAKCIDAPVSASSDAYLEVRGSQPYQIAEGTIRAGVGSNAFTTEDDKGVRITCDGDHPCKLVLMVQVPYGYGFQEFPLTYR